MSQLRSPLPTGTFVRSINGLTYRVTEPPRYSGPASSDIYLEMPNIQQVGPFWLGPFALSGAALGPVLEVVTFGLLVCV